MRTRRSYCGALAGLGFEVNGMMVAGVCAASMMPERAPAVSMGLAASKAARKDGAQTVSVLSRLMAGRSIRSAYYACLTVVRFEGLPIAAMCAGCWGSR